MKREINETKTSVYIALEITYINFEFIYAKYFVVDFYLC